MNPKKMETAALIVSVLLIGIISVIMITSSSSQSIGFVVNPYIGAPKNITPTIIPDPVVIYKGSIWPDNGHLLRCVNDDCSGGTSSINALGLSLGPSNIFRVKLQSSNNPYVLFDENNSTFSLNCNDSTCSSYVRTLIPTVLGTDNPKKFIIPSDGKPFIIIGERLNNRTTLKAIKCGNTNCSVGNSITTLYTSPLGQYVYYNSSIVLGSDGYPRIAWINPISVGGSLNYIQCLNNACSSFTSTFLENAAGFNPSISLAISSNGKPVIGYLSSQSRIRVFRCSALDCTNGGSAYEFSNLPTQAFSMVLPPDNRPMFAYTTYLSGSNYSDLNVLKCGDENCFPAYSSTFTIENDVEERTPSIVLSRQGSLPVIFSSKQTHAPPWQVISAVQCKNYSCSVSSKNVLDPNHSAYLISSDT